LLSKTCTAPCVDAYSFGLHRKELLLSTTFWLFEPDLIFMHIQVWSNCLEFNEPSSDIAADARACATAFERLAGEWV